MNAVCTVMMAWLLAWGASAQAAAPVLAGIDVYRTSAFDSALLRTELAADVAALSAAEDAHDLAAAKAAKERIASSLQQRGDFALVEVTLMQYHREPAVQYLTVDVVERADRARRMPFSEPPRERLEDPEGVIDLWLEYQKQLVALRQAGAFSAAPCEVLHCLLPFKPYPQLLPYLERINDKVQRHEALLYEMAAKDSRATVRGMALYLLAHSRNADRLLPALARAIHDPSAVVRNNAMRIMGQMAEREPQLAYPIEDLVRAMDFALATDRNKAAYVLSKLVKSRHRERIIELALPSALRQLRLQQPINHDPAFELLKGLSGEAHDERDYAAWERWAAQQSTRHEPRAEATSR